MTLLALPSIKKTGENSKQSPLKNKTFFGIPRHIALMPGITDRIFRLMAILCSAYGEDGHIEFKVKTLAEMMNKGDRQTRDLIKEAERKELIWTKETGRSLQFFLADIFFEPELKAVQKSADQNENLQKSAGQVGGNPPGSYKEQKQYNKKKKQQPKKPVVVSLFDKKIESAIKDRPDIERGWIEDSLKLPNQSVENVLMAITKSETADNSTAFIRAALKNGWIFKKPDIVKISKNINDMEVKQKLMGSKVKFVNYDSIYEIDANGAILTDHGTFNEVQVEKMIGSGKLIYAD